MYYIEYLSDDNTFIVTYALFKEVDFTSAILADRTGCVVQCRFTDKAKAAEFLLAAPFESSAPVNKSEDPMFEFINGIETRPDKDKTNILVHKDFLMALRLR